MLSLSGKDLAIGYALIACAIGIILIPIIWIFSLSLKYQIDIYTGAWFFKPTLFNYHDVLFGIQGRFTTNVANSLVVSTASTIVVLVVGTLAAYSLSFVQWSAWVSSAFLAWTLLFHMIPVMTIVGPWYLLFQHIGLYNTLSGLIITHVTMNLPITIWLMMAFFGDIPPEISEAARVDGCSAAQAFWRIILPLAVPGLIASGVIAFIFSWNEFAIALNLTARNTATVPVAIARFAQQYQVQNGQMAAASMISSVPAFLLMLFGQRFVVRGLTLGAVK
jgi:multiple sugar transport system permease protein